ncbi:DNA helicase [Gordonia phage Holliday]|nr:DNA helicase [Gordonia phage Holliday]
MSYQQFLAAKAKSASRNDLHVPAGDLNPSLHEWQSRIVSWAIEVGRAAIWADTGLGKTRMQLEWAWQHTLHTSRPALVITPLAVCEQTVREAHRMGIAEVRYVRDQSEVAAGINVTNYERVPDFIPDFCAVVLDESSILKQSTGRTRTMLIEWASEVPARLACSATPAPNDPEELTNQAEWLGRMQRNHMLAAYFVHDQDGWRLKGHARGPMIEWMSSWAVAIRRPSDIGGDDHGYDLPGLDIQSHFVEADLIADGQLFATELGGVSGRAQVRKQTLAKRVAVAAELVAAEPGEPWVMWCGLNDEADALTSAIPGAVNVHGSLDPDEKARLLLGFADGDYKVIVTKPSIASLGLNWQHCARMAFVGLSDSYEQYYQAMRRCYRYGQNRVVQAHIILSDLESQIATNVARKERQASEITTALIDHARKAYAA